MITDARHGNAWADNDEEMKHALNLLMEKTDCNVVITFGEEGLNCFITADGASKNTIIPVLGTMMTYASDDKRFNAVAKLIERAANDVIKSHNESWDWHGKLSPEVHSLIKALQGDINGPSI